MSLLRLLKDRKKFGSINQLYAEVIDKFGFTEKSTKEYVSQIIDSFSEFSYLKKLRNINQRWFHLETLNDYVECLKDEIMKDKSLLKEIEKIIGTELKEGYAPMRYWLTGPGYYKGFLDSIKGKSFDYLDVVKQAGLRYPADVSDSKSLGTLEHWIAERWILQFLREIWGCNTYYETRSILNGIRYNGKHPDLAAVIGDGDESKSGYSKKLFKFREWLFSQKVLPFTSKMKENIHQINLDFFHSINIEGMADKAKRRYHGKHNLLIIVLTGTEQSGEIFRKQLLEHDDVKNLDHKENIFVLNKKEFAEFIGLKENIKTSKKESYYNKFMEGSELFGNAFYGEDAEEEKLIDVSDVSRIILQDKFLKTFGEADGSTAGWVEYLKFLKLTKVIKDNPYPYKQEEEDDATITTSDNFLGEK